MISQISPSSLVSEAISRRFSSFRALESDIDVQVSALRLMSCADSDKLLDFLGPFYPFYRSDYKSSQG